MKLSSLMREAGLGLQASTDPEITGVRLDSRKVGKGNLFLALKGAHDDGSRYVADVIVRGAAAVLSEGNSHPALEGAIEPHPGAEIIPCPGLRAHVGDVFNAWYGRPAEGMETVAVTGTNGKSTITKLATGLLKAAGRKVISLGTISYDIDGEALPSDLTTPGPDEFFAMLRMGADRKCTALSMEVSSHALSQERIRGVLFSRAIFTNLTRDHMDYHRDFEDYYQAKKRLFTSYLRPGGIAILNADSQEGLRLGRELTCDRLTFARSGTADVVLTRSDLSLSGTSFDVSFRGVPFKFRSRLVGAINLENLLAAVTLGFSLGMDAGTIDKGIRDVTVMGRNQVFSLPQRAYAVVDYAHTPDALERVLISLRPLTKGRLVCLFGCGGDRDRTKRPIMGGIAAERADIAFLTSDNPRTENPAAILEEVLGGIPDRSKVTVVADRREAIRAALDCLGEGDCLLIAGKGHEDYQIIGKEKRHFSDQEEILVWAESKAPPAKLEAGREAGGTGGGHGA
ncbi:MAG: UDP-N-acetylmuramoyl-L-alanyl-D-glutamate--2,6-diaminopimelate ligase [Fibrobacteres bacterium]|nr:UDP-N-acetylmuramoyl-L-alanyl-D-glutamate--2,6-diaminopimelate ligase [Fibrobacterota bacterium]